jgi:hypothetical protein
MAYIKNTATGVYDTVPEHYLGHPILGKNLVLVEDEVLAAPKNKITKEQPAPEAEPVVAEPETTK